MEKKRAILRRNKLSDWKKVILYVTQRTKLQHTPIICKDCNRPIKGRVYWSFPLKNKTPTHKSKLPTFKFLISRRCTPEPHCGICADKP